MKKLYVSFVGIIILLSACHRESIVIKNKYYNKLKSTHQLEVIMDKTFILDNETAPKSPYMQLYTDNNGKKVLSFLNNYTNSIYLYDYTTGLFLDKIIFDRKGPDAVLSIAAYYIQTLDSIYLYNRPLTEIVLANSESKVLSRISLRGDNKMDNWFVFYPQYTLRTVNPIMKLNNELILVGQHLNSITENEIEKFRFLARLDIATGNVKFNYLYPKELYQNYNWDGRAFTDVFPTLIQKSKQMIFSFPISHDLYISTLHSEEYDKVFAGSNSVKSIKSMNYKINKVDDIVCVLHYKQQNTYASILYDKYRNVYYRFLLKAIPNATISTNWRYKPISIIILDADFNYLGETEIGIGDKEWIWENSFITEEGLNIEYVKNNVEETNLELKIFKIVKL